MSCCSHWFAGAHPATDQAVRDLQGAVRTETVPELLEQVYRRFRVREHHFARGGNRVGREASIGEHGESDGVELDF